MDMQQFQANMLPYPDPSHFDYAAFLSGAPTPYQQPSPLNHAMSTPSAQGSSSPGLNDKSPDSTSADSSNSSTTLARRPQARQRLERRGHTKSRRGCYNCKRRRIKVRNTP